MRGRKPNPNDTVCCLCGSDNIDNLEWCNVNTGKPSGSEAPDYRVYCNGCDTDDVPTVYRDQLAGWQAEREEAAS